MAAACLGADRHPGIDISKPFGVSGLAVHVSFPFAPSTCLLTRTMCMVTMAGPVHVRPLGTVAIHSSPDELGSLAADERRWWHIQHRGCCRAAPRTPSWRADATPVDCIFCAIEDVGMPNLAIVSGGAVQYGNTHPVADT